MVVVVENAHAIMCAQKKKRATTVNVISLILALALNVERAVLVENAENVQRTSFAMILMLVNEKQSMNPLL